MPELGIRKTPFIEYAIERSAVKAGRSKDYPSGLVRNPTVRKWARNFDQPLIGSGDESIIIPHPTDSEKVVAIWYQSNSIWTKTMEDARFVYYWHQILNSLFPHNFPKIYAAFGAPVGNKEVVRGTIRQKITQCKNKPLYPFSAISEFLGLLPFFYENYQLNLGVNLADKGEYYLDLVNRVPKKVFEGQFGTYNKHQTKQMILQKAQELPSPHREASAKTIRHSINRLEYYDLFGPEDD